MLSKCANPVCSSQFRLLCDGKLFHVQAAQREPEGAPRVQHFWLCDSCAREFRVVASAEGTPVIVATAQAVLSDGGHILS